MRKGIAAAALVASFGAAAPSSAYTTLYAFGDSLSDVGNVYAASGILPNGPYPISPPYAPGRFSNGPNWVDDLSAKLGLGAAAPSFTGGDDFAVGGAETGPTAVSAIPLPILKDVPFDLEQQVGWFVDHRTPTPGALYTLDIGANDIGAALSADPSSAKAVVDQAAQNTLTAINALYADGARSLLYFEVPDLSLVPAYMKYGALAGELASDFNQQVLSGLVSLEKDGLTVFDVPIYTALQNIVADGGAYGLSNVTDPCFSGDYKTSGTVCGAPDSYLFWDNEHPTAAAHALTAGMAYDVLEGLPDPVGAPEPPTWAMMLAGLAGLGLIRTLFLRRRAVTATR